MRCPACGTDDCYTGLQWVHCVNEECDYYDPRYVEQLRREKDGEGTLYDVHLNDKVEKLILLRGKVDNTKKP